MTRRPEPANTTRREFLTLGVGALAIMGVPLVRSRRRLFRRTIPVMGTTAEIAVVHNDVGYAQGAIDAALQRLRLVERVLTRFDDSSDVGRANLHAAVDAVRVSPLTARVLRASLRWAERTDGRFDPCLGRAMALWDPEHRAAPPEAGAVRAFAGRRLYRALDLGTIGGRPAVRFTDPACGIDLGGIGKGLGVDEAARVLREWGITNAIVNVGGDLYAMGRSVDGDPWTVGVRSPERPDAIIATVPVEDAAVATSGDYLRYFEYRGRRYHHLLDPGTGAPRTSKMHSLTVRAADCLTADAAATAGFGGQVVGAEVVHVA